MPPLDAKLSLMPTRYSKPYFVAMEIPTATKNRDLKRTWRLRLTWCFRWKQAPNWEQVQMATTGNAQTASDGATSIRKHLPQRAGLFVVCGTSMTVTTARAVSVLCQGSIP